MVILWSEGRHLHSLVVLMGAQTLLGMLTSSPAVAGAASLADLAGDVAVGVSSPAVAGAASLADLAGDVAVGVSSPAVAGAASLADLAGDVATGVISPAELIL